MTVRALATGDDVWLPAGVVVLASAQDVVDAVRCTAPTFGLPTEGPS